MASVPNSVRINFTIDGDGVVSAHYPSLNISKSISVGTLKENLKNQYSLQGEIKVYSPSGEELNDLLIIENTGLVDNDNVKVIVINPDVAPVFGANAASQQMPAWLGYTPDAVIAQIVSNPSELQQLLINRPQIGQAVLNCDVFTIQQWQFQERQKWQARLNRERQRVAQLHADPLDPNAQARIMEEIRQSNVEQNYNATVEHMPEAFGRVVMLYVPMIIEGTKVHAFVDSGAQTTIISKKIAEQTNVLRLLDRRFAGVAKGVGTARILGKIHMANIKFGSLNLACSFTVMESPDMEFLFGLDMLKRHQACIDLGKNCLRLRGEEVKFLSEGEISDFRDRKDVQMALADKPENRPSQSTLPNTSNASQTSSQPASNVSVPAPVPVSNPPVQLPASQQSQFSQESITQLTNLGFTRDQTLQALRACNGNAELAASMLFSQQMGW